MSTHGDVTNFHHLPGACPECDADFAATSIDCIMAGGKAAVLTTEHAASSYGQPVLVVDGVAYRPADTIPASAGIGLAGRCWGEVNLGAWDYIGPKPALLTAWESAVDHAAGAIERISGPAL